MTGFNTGYGAPGYVAPVGTSTTTYTETTGYGTGIPPVGGYNTYAPGVGVGGVSTYSATSGGFGTGVNPGVVGLGGVGYGGTTTVTPAGFGGSTTTYSTGPVTNVSQGYGLGGPSTTVTTSEYSESVTRY